MHGEVVQPNGLQQYAIPLGVFAVIFALRARRMTRMRPLKIEQLWIVPALYLLLVVGTFIATPPSATGWGVSLLALVIGGALGWQRGRMMAIHVDPETHALSQKGSAMAILFLFAIIAIKIAAQGEGKALHFDVALVTDAALALALGMFAMTRLEMYLRAKRLLAEAQAARGEAPLPS
jgi:hypothetical protein